MRKMILFMMPIALALSACNQAQLDADMARAKQVLTAIRQGAAVTASAVRQGIDAACANQATVGTTYQAARAILLQQIGPNSVQNITNLDRAMSDYTGVCAQASDPNSTNLASLLSRAIAAYAAFQTAKAKAGA